MHSVVFPYSLPNTVNTMQESVYLTFRSLQLNSYMENAVFSFQVQNLFQIIFQLKSICWYFFCYGLPKKWEEKVPQTNHTADIEVVYYPFMGLDT